MKTALELAHKHAFLGCAPDTKRGHRLFGARLATEAGLVGLEAERFARTYADAFHALQGKKTGLPKRHRESWAA